MSERLELRPEVAAFAQLMERQLRKHDATRGVAGWQGEDPWHMLDRIEIKQRQMRDAMDMIDGWGNHPDTPDEMIAAVGSKAADAANFAMMVADLHEALPKAAPYVDSTPELHVGESSFESWAEAYKPAPGTTAKQAARDAYAAGMGDPLVMAKPGAEHDSLRDNIGQAISDAMDEMLDGVRSDDGWVNPAHEPDWCDSRNIDLLADAAVRAVLAARSVPDEVFGMESMTADHLQGYDYAVKQHCDAVWSVLNGADRGEGASPEPWGPLRSLLVTLVREVGEVVDTAKRVVAAHEGGDCDAAIAFARELARDEP